MHENTTLVCFVILEDRSSAFSELLAFARYLGAFSVGQEGHSLNSTDIPYNGDSHKIFELVYFKYDLFESGLILKTDFGD